MLISMANTKLEEEWRKASREYFSNLNYVATHLPQDDKWRKIDGRYFLNLHSNTYEVILLKKPEKVELEYPRKKTVTVDAIVSITSTDGLNEIYDGAIGFNKGKFIYGYLNYDCKFGQNLRKTRGLVKALLSAKGLPKKHREAITFG